MQILTPAGYRDIADCTVGDSVSAFDVATGAPIVNAIESKQWVDAAVFRDWQNPVFLINGVEHFGLHSLLVLCPPKNAPEPVQVRDLAIGSHVFKVDSDAQYVFDYTINAIVQVDPYLPFRFFRINGTWILNSEQSIWRNGAGVCHARDLNVGDVIHDDADHDVTISSIEEAIAEGWWRFDISGDHSYIVDGVTLHNASRFWVGGTGTWDSSTTTPWAASSGSTGGQTVPGSADTVTFDSSSGGGTVTVNFGGSISIQALNIASFGGTWDNSAHSNNFTISQQVALNFAGSGVRTIKLGTATYTLTAGNARIDCSTTSNLTYTGNTGCTFAFTSGTGARVFFLGGLSHGNVTISQTSSAGYFAFSGNGTLATLSLSAPNYIVENTGNTITVSAAMTIAGTSSAAITFASNNNLTSQYTIACAAGSTFSWCIFRDMIFTGSPTASNSFDQGNNTGITISGPSAGGGGGGGVIGS